MTTRPAVTMKSAIEQILQAHGILERFLTNPDFNEEIEVVGRLPLWIRREDDHVTISHYRVVEGIPVSDPEMEFRMIDHMYVPVWFLDSNGQDFLALTTGARAELCDLAGLWAGNLLALGYLTGIVVAA